MTSPERERIVERVLELDCWQPSRLGPCGVRAGQARRVAEIIVDEVLEAVAVKEAHP